MGLLRDSSAVVIAAMLIAPLMTPILGIASAVVMGWNGRAFRLLVIVLVAALASIGVAWLMMYVANVPLALNVPAEVVARTDPGVEELVVALAAGAAGAYVQINRKEISLLPGAAIGVALVPPLAASGILFYFGSPKLAQESALLFVTNLAAIVLSAASVYVASARQAVLRNARRRLARFSLGYIATLLIIGGIAIELSRETFERFTATRLEAETGRAILDWAGEVPVELLRVDVNPNRDFAEIWLVVDLPLTSSSSIATVQTMIGDDLEGDELVTTLRRILGPKFEIAFRYQTRYAGAISLFDGAVEEAPPVSETIEVAPESE